MYGTDFYCGPNVGPYVRIFGIQPCMWIESIEAIHSNDIRPRLWGIIIDDDDAP